jgi:hypothetical protein
LAPATLEALAAARPLGTVHVATLGEAADGLADLLAAHGAAQVHQVHHPLLADYGPEAWGDAVAQLVWSLNPEVVLACGTDRGNEVMAHLAAITDLPFVANCLEVHPGDATWSITRVRWGGSLLEQCELSAGRKLVSVAHHAVEASEAPVASTTAVFTPELDAALARTVVSERVERAAGVTLATSPVVVGGGRGVGSPEGFGPLEEHDSTVGPEILPAQPKTILEPSPPLAQPLRLARHHQGLEAIPVEISEDGDGGRGHHHIAQAGAPAGLGSPPPLPEKPIFEQSGPFPIQGAAQAPGIGGEVGLALEAGQPRCPHPPPGAPLWGRRPRRAARGAGPGRRAHRCPVRRQGGLHRTDGTQAI